MSKTILITGVSSGFGRDTAETLRHAGHSVYASMRSVQSKNREAAETLRKLGVKVVELDVNDDTSVEAARLASTWLSLDRSCRRCRCAGSSAPHGYCCQLIAPAGSSA